MKMGGRSNAACGVSRSLFVGPILLLDPLDMGVGA